MPCIFSHGTVRGQHILRFMCVWLVALHRIEASKCLVAVECSRFKQTTGRHGQLCGIMAITILLAVCGTVIGVLGKKARFAFYPRISVFYTLLVFTLVNIEYPIIYVLPAGLLLHCTLGLVRLGTDGVSRFLLEQRW